MADRILARDVQEIFTNFCQAASRAGFNTIGWTLLAPEMKGNVWRLQEKEEWRVNGKLTDRKFHDTPFPSHLDATNREVYYRIQAWMQCLTAIRSNRADVETGSQIG
ncbi:hypothetical protein [Micromonospora sp. CB01531]|uniref:hypothetical protein n=1 Tax=Micromonospora sp. CB01531 TaxID=1718947 RepID=UPI000ADD9D25|nr:hypothetical protein [Micromonospora sp. CB01531]